MKKRGRRIIITACVIVICICIAILLQPLYRYSRTVYTNWKYDLPVTYREVYEYSEPSFHGDGYRYHVFQYWKSKKAIEQLYTRESADKSEKELDSDITIISEWLDEMDVPENVRPDYKECLWQSAKQEDGSVIYLLWNPKTFTLYIAESFM